MTSTNLKIRQLLMTIFNHPLISGIERVASWLFSGATNSRWANQKLAPRNVVSLPSSIPNYLTTNLPSASNNPKLSLPKATASTVVNKPRGFAKEWFNNVGPTATLPPGSQELRHTPSVEDHVIEKPSGAGTGHPQVSLETR